MASVIGSLEIQLLANIARLQSDMNKATRTVDSAMGSISKSVAGAQKLLLGLGVGVSFGVLIGQVNKAIDTLAKLDDMAQKTGSSVENLSRLQKVASQFGADFGAVDVAIGKLAKGLAGIDDSGGKTAKALNAIGISQQFVKNNDPSQVMVQVAKKLQNYQDGASKAALATDLFGKAGIEILPYLNDVAENVDKVTGASSRSAAEAAKFQDDLGGLKLKFDEYATNIAITVMPAATAFIAALTDSRTESDKLLKNDSALSWADSLGLGLSRVVDVMSTIPSFFKAISLSFEVVLQDIRTINEAAKLGNPLELYRDAKAGKNPLGDFAKQIDSRNKTLKEAGAAYDNLWNKPANVTEQAYLKAIKNRPKSGASPYASPNSDKPKLNYAGAEAEASMASKSAAAASKAEAARKKALEAYQKQKDEFAKLDEQYDKVVLKAENEALDEKRKLYIAQKKEFSELDAKFIKITDKAENDSLDEKYKREKDAIDKLAKEQEETAKEINKSLTDALLRGFESGKGFAKNFRDTLLNMFQTLILRPTISAIIDGSGITKLISGLGTSISSSVSGVYQGITGTGSSSLFSSIKDLSGAIKGNLTSSIESLGSFFSNGSGGFGDAIGGFLGTNAGAIANYLPYAGAVIQALSGDLKGAAFTAAGAAIGSIIPGVGTAIGAVVGSLVGSLFSGKKLPPRVTENRQGTFTKGVFSASEGNAPGKRKLGAASALDGLNEQFSKNLNSLFQAFDVNQVIGTNSTLTRKKSTSGGFTASLDGQQVGEFSERVKKKGDFQKILENLVNNALGSVTVQAIQHSRLPQAIRDLFDGFTKKEEVTGLINATIGLNQAQAQLASRFSITVDQSAQVAKSTGLMGDALISFVNQLSAAAMAFKTPAQSLLEAKAALTGAFKANSGSSITQAITELVARQVQVLQVANPVRINTKSLALGEGLSSLAYKSPTNNQVATTRTVFDTITSFVTKLIPSTKALPKSLDEYDKALKSIDKTTAGGIEQFKQLFAIREQFSAFTKAMDSIKAGVNGAIFDLLSPAEQQARKQADLAKLFKQFNIAVPGSVKELIAIGNSINYTTEAGLDLALVFPSLVSAFNETQTAAEDLFNSLRDESTFKTLIDFNRYKGVANNYSTSFANSYVDKLPSYDVGTDYVPNDGLAMIHKGEAIIPAKYNNGSGGENVVAAINRLDSRLARIEQSGYETQRNTANTTKILSNVTPNGNAIKTEAA